MRRRGRVVAQHVRSITVLGLFGRYNYEIDLTQQNPTEHSLAILYGQNGSGKSTILRILYHALSSSTVRAHRTSLAHMPFSYARIVLSDGNWISYENYTTEKRQQQRLRAEAFFDGAHVVETMIIGRDGRIDASTVSEEQQSVASFTSMLNIEPVILTDTRQFFSDLLEPDDDVREEVPADGRQGASLDVLLNSRRSADLVRAVDLVETYFGFRIFRASREGLVQVDQTYASIVEQIVSSEQGAGRPRKRTIPDLMARVAELARQSEPFADYGLLPEVEYEDLISSLDAAADKSGPILASVLSPYLEGMEQRLESMLPILRTLDAYISLTSDFLADKRVYYEAEDSSISVVDDFSHSSIELTSLSSGERQLLVLLSVVTAMRDRSKLFIIDEPELSLNPSWVRSIIPALLTLMNDSQMQLMCATHSIEILAPYDRNVVDLDENRV